MTLQVFACMMMSIVSFNMTAAIRQHVRAVSMLMLCKHGCFAPMHNSDMGEEKEDNKTVKERNAFHHGGIILGLSILSRFKFDSLNLMRSGSLSFVMQVERWVDIE